MNERLIVQLPVSETTDFDSLVDLEDGLIQLFVGNPGVEVNGHEIGQGRFNIFISSSEPWAPIVGRIRAFLEFHELERPLIVLDPGNGEGYEIWLPTDYRGAFEL